MSLPGSQARGGRGRRWASRVLILAGVLISLALVGERTASSSMRWGHARIDEVGDGTPRLALALNGVVSAYHTVQNGSDATVEMLSLLVAGITLIGSARWLERRHRRERAKAERAADSRDVVLAVLRPQSHADPTARRAAR